MMGGTLSSVRVLDLTRVWSGPLATRMLADFGAEVIKLSDPRVPVDRTHGTNNKLNRNKLSLALRLGDARGRDIFEQLVNVSDVVIENFRPRVMRNFGLTYDALKRIKPDIIMASMPGFGTTGEYADYPAFGPSVETMTGITSLMAYPGGSPMVSSIAYPDPIAALNGVSAVMTALWHRKRTGQGQFIDLSLAEGPVAQIGEHIVAFSGNRKQPVPVGNSHPDYAPYGCYPASGDDRWITICVTSEPQWHTLCDVMGQPSWTKDDRFSDAGTRCAHRDELDVLLGEWTSKQDAHALMRTLQERGIAAGVALDAKEMLEDPHLNERGFFAEITEPDVGAIRYPGQPIRMSATPVTDWQRPSPRLGEHTHRILKGLLNTPDETISALEAEGVIGSLASD